jgi:hypothetical protein
MGTCPIRHDQMSEETRIGRALLRLQGDAYTKKPSWVNRRVEHLEFLDTRATSRRISVDFKVPATAPCISAAGQEFRLVPITTLPKGNLSAFDFRDENGAALWLPTSEECSKLLVPAITHWATEILGKASPRVKVNMSEISSDLTEIVSEDPASHSEKWVPFGAAAALIDARSSYKNAKNYLTQMSAALREIYSLPLRERLHFWPFLWTLRRWWGLAQDRVNAATERRDAAEQAWSEVAAYKQDAAMTLMKDIGFRSQLEELARNFVVLAAVTNPPNTRRIIKLAFESSSVTFRRPRSRLARLQQSAGWRCWPVEVLIGARGGSHHLEATAPPGIDIVRITARPAGEGTQGAPISEPGGSPHAHIYAPASSPYRYRARIFLRVSRPGWLTASWLMAFVIAVVLIAGRMRLSVIFSDPSGGPAGAAAGTAATLLLALLAVIATVLTRPGEHPLASRLLLLARILILVDAVVVLIASGALVLHRVKQPVNGTLWDVLAGITIGVVVLLTLSRLLPRRRQRME